MTRALTNVRSALTQLWHTDRPLTAAGLVMVLAFAATVVGLVVDVRTIAGAPAWLKPAKFALSTAVYAFTMAWIFGWLTEWTRVRRVVSWTTAIVFVVEVAIIGVQAWRGTTSHFNVGTPLDAVLFAVMGTSIATQTIASVAVAVALWRQPIRDRAVGAALRAGMTISILGAASAGLMTAPTAAQLQGLSEAGTLPVAGAHTVGAPDGGPGLPGVGWSRDHGDLRIPHFFGLHALQALPLLALATRRRLASDRRIRVVRTANVAYGALFAILLVQALRGEPLLAPGSLTCALLCVWAASSAAAALWARGRAVSPRPITAEA